MERYNCTCHCGGSMFYKHLHDPSCDLFTHGEEAPQSKEAQLQAALDAERANRLAMEACVDRDVKAIKDLKAQLATLQAQLARWKEALGEWLWNCTNLLGDYHIKTVQDFNEEVNRRIAWLMQHLDHTLPPPMTDEERDRMRKLSEDNAALQADNECKDSLIETLQAQLVAEQQRADRAVKDRSDVLDVKTKEGLSCSEWLMRTAIAERKAKDLEAQLQQVEQANARLREALQPFAERWEYFERTKHPSGDPWPEHLEYADDEPSAIYLGQLKAAQQALADTDLKENT